MIAAFVVALLAQNSAIASVDTRPDVISPGVVAVAFAAPPTVRTHFKRDEPFLEGDLHYAYTGVITSDVVVPQTFGHRVAIPAGTPAYGVPMTSSIGGGPHLVWCALLRDAAKAEWHSACLAGQGYLPVLQPIFLQSILLQTHGTVPFVGGRIETKDIDLGAPVHIKLYVRNLGQIPRLSGVASVGTDRPDTWGEQWGTVLRKYDGGPTVIAIAGGVISLSPDPTDHNGYVASVIVPLGTGPARPRELQAMPPP